MTQRQITINAYPPASNAVLTHAPSAFDFGGKTPSKRSSRRDRRRLQGRAAAFAAELEPAGKPWHLSVSFRQAIRTQAGRLR